MFENILVDVDGRPSLLKMGKLAILWQLDRKTGAFVRAIDLGLQNILDVEPGTGKVTYRPGKIRRPNSGNVMIVFALPGPAR